MVVPAELPGINRVTVIVARSHADQVENTVTFNKKMTKNCRVQCILYSTHIDMNWLAGPECSSIIGERLGHC